jgi:tetratricopeptide (TPR) repeat protein
MTVASTYQSSGDSRVLQYYKPMSLSEENHVSVSGLDLSRDGKELLVSYESDQIYTFPVFPCSQSPRRAVTDQLEELLSKDTDMDREDEENRLYPWGHGKRILPELAAYGAHLNRFTFLKNARYAGPRDEYICTGSDSGHAWIYEKASGAVVSFWKADQSTCNGVVPHPTLPIFVTYGIDSTAKLWRSTIPVDSDVDDSAIGRRKHFRLTQERSYTMTPTVRNWGEVQSILENLALREAGTFSEESDIYPDQIPCSKVLIRRGRLARAWFRESAGNSGGRLGMTKIGNDLHNLSDALKGNLYTVLRSLFDDDDVPVESDVDEFKQRISLIRLRHQADSLGLTWNPTIPWMMEGQSTVDSLHQTLKDPSHHCQVEPSELVPEYPSDWIPYDAEMNDDPFDFRDYFCSKSNGLYTDFYRDRYYALDERGIMSSDCCSDDSERADICGRGVSEHSGNIQPMKHDEDMVDMMNAVATNMNVDKREIVDNDEEREDTILEKQKSSRKIEFVRRSNRLLAETVKILKDGGNAAFKAGKLGLAAYRYDKAIQYGSVAYMNNHRTNMLRFDGLLKNLVMTRLNMALILLNSHFMELQVATKQAKLALKEVSPFCDPSIHENKKYLDEALALKAKACFRLGSAQYEMGDYSDSISSLEESIKSTKEISNPKENTPDSLLLKRLSQAKKEHSKHAKRQRKKFKFAFSPQSSRPQLGVEAPSSPESSPSTRSPPAALLQAATTVESVVDSAVSDATVTTPNTSRTTINTVTPLNSPALETQAGAATSTRITMPADHSDME